MFARQALALLLVLTLAFPAWAVPIVVGNVASSESATVRGTALAPGSTVFSGDTIEVGPKGIARLALTDGAQVQIAGDSQVRLTKTSDTIQLTVDRGLTAFLATEKSAIEALLGDATIRPANGTAAIGVINVRSPETAVIAAQKGTLLISTAHDSKTVTLREGQGAEVTLAQDNPQQTPEEKKKKKRGGAAVPGGSAAPAGSWSAGKVVIIAIILGGVATATGFLLGRSEVELTQQQKCLVVSPFRCP
jgi:hypothetical protein